MKRPLLKAPFISDQTIHSPNCHAVKKPVSEKAGDMDRQVLESAAVFLQTKGRRAVRPTALKLFCVLFFVSACIPWANNSSSASPTTVICNCGIGDIVRGRGESRQVAESAAQEKCDLIGGPAVTKCKPVR